MTTSPKYGGMSTISIGNAGVVSTGANLVGNNAITSALGISTLAGGTAGPLTFLTKFGKPSVFSPSSLPYTIRTTQNFTVIFHWFPKCSQIRSYFADAFNAADTDELPLWIRSVHLPDLQNDVVKANNGRGNNHFTTALAGGGVNGTGNLRMDILSTEFSLVDHCFYQWLRETESPYWIYGPNLVDTSVYKEYRNVFTTVFGRFNESEANKKIMSSMDAYEGYAYVGEGEAKYTRAEEVEIRKKIGRMPERVIKQVEYKNDWSSHPVDSMIRLQSLSQSTPFTRADIEIKFFSSNMKELHSIICYGAFPIKIETMDPTHKEKFDESHTVEFAYDSIDVVSPFVAQNNGGVTNAVLDATAEAGLGGGANWTVGLNDSVVLDYLNKSWLAKATRMVNRATTKAGSNIAERLNSVQRNIGVGMA